MSSAPDTTIARVSVAELHEAIAALQPDKECLIFRDQRLTWADVTERTRRLANYLISQNLGCHTEREHLLGHESGQDHLAIYLHNGNEYLETMLGCFKARVAPFNVNYRYVAEELTYLLNDSQATAIVVHSQFAPILLEVLPNLPRLRVIIQVRDGSANELLPGAVWYEDALEQSLATKPDVVWSGDDLYILYTGGTTGFPKGVMWRHEDIYRVLLGGTDFATGEFVADEYDHARQAAAGPPMIRYPIPPMIHGATQSATWMALFSGQTAVLAPEFDADEVWRMIEKHKVNLLFFTGDAMGRPLLDALEKSKRDLSSLFLLASTAALFSPSLKERFLELLPNRVITDSIGSSETGFGGTSVVAKGATQAGGPRVTIDKKTVVLDDDGNEVKPGSGVRGILAKRGNIPVGYYKDEKKTAETFRTINGVRYAIPGDYAQVEEDGTVVLWSGEEELVTEENWESVWHWARDVWLES